MMVGPHVQLYIYGYKRTEQLWFKPNYGSSFSRNVHSRVQELTVQRAARLSRAELELG